MMAQPITMRTVAMTIGIPKPPVIPAKPELQSNLLFMQNTFEILSVYKLIHKVIKQHHSGKTKLVLEWFMF